MELDDLVLAVQGGDSRASRELARRLTSDLVSFLRTWLGEADARDVAQITLMIVFRKLPEFEVRAGEPFRNWVRAIARTQVREAFRQQGRRERVAADYAGVQRTPLTNLSSQLDRAAKLELVKEGLAKLDTPHRRVVENDLRDSKPGSFAEREHIKAATVRTRRHRAHQQLRRLVRARGKPTPDTPSQR